MAVRDVEHEIVVDAGADEVYGLLADVANWPRIFPPTIHVRRLDETDGTERIRIWATANGDVRDWTSLRVLDPTARRIEFRQEISPPPVASMTGSWQVEPLTDNSSRVRLGHTYRAVDDDPVDLERIDRAVDTNSQAELAALAATAEPGTDELTFSLTDSVRVDGAAKDLYDFVYEANRWAERLPHVASVRLTESAPGVQLLEMDTLARDGSTHTTRSHRVCLPSHGIAYKQVTLPPLMRLHTGYWSFRDTGDGVVATSRHTVVLNQDNFALLGPGADAAAARELVANSLSANSRATLDHARAYAEARR
ncbi:aromatase/cyclase [Actinophytocola sediminis]